MLVMIDNYDSFTYNLVQYFGELGEEVRVFRNDQISVGELQKLLPSRIVILGVCLGHQSIGQVFGGRIVHARETMHGKTSMIHHQGKGVFKGIKAPFTATRYHSLVIEKKSLPASLEVTAWTQAGADGTLDEIMGVRHKELPIEGVQFHPESILTEYGRDLLRNFLATT
jgi:anthranilate synthase component II